MAEKQDWVLIKNSTVEGTALVHPDSVEFWGKSGWKPVGKTEPKPAVIKSEGNV